MFESLDDKSKLLATVQRAFVRQRDTVTTLGIGGGPFDRRPEPSKQRPVNFVDTTGGVKNEPLTTQIGAGVPSPQLDEIIRRSWSSDLKDRSEYYQECDRIIYSDPIAAISERDLIDGAFGQGYVTKVEPSEAIKEAAKKNPRLLEEAERMAANIDPIWQMLESKQPLKKKKARARAYLRYGMVPLEIVYGPAGIVNYRGLAPHGIKINSDIDLEFASNQMDAYQQIDPYTLQQIIRNGQPVQWPESGIVLCGNFELEWLRYPVSPMLSGMSYFRALVRGTAVLPDARESALPRVVRSYGDAANNSIDGNTLRDTEYNSRESRKRRGEAINAYEDEIINGNLKEIKMLAANTDYFNKLEDLKWFASGVSALLGMNMARILNPDTITRSTMEKIDEMVFTNQYNFLLTMVDEIDRPVLDRVISWTNTATVEARRREGRKDESLIANSRYLQLKVYAKARRVPEQLTIEAQTAIAARNAKEGPIISLIDANEVVTRALELDHETSLKRLEEEKSKPVEPPPPPQKPTQPDAGMMADDQEPLDQFIQ